MSWEDQGRQQHGWFGHGTSGNDGMAPGRDTVSDVAYSALAQLPALQRGAYEAWLDRSGLAHPRAALPEWVANARMPAAQFQDSLFGPHSSTAAAGLARAVGADLAGSAPGKDGAAAVKAAGANLAGLVRSVRVEAMGHVMLAAARHAERHRAAATPHRPPGPAHPRHGAQPHPATPPTTAEAERRKAEELKKRNITNLAAILYAEARGDELPPDSMAAIGSTVLNRMRRNNETDVTKVWGAYSHPVPTPRPGSRNALAWVRAQQVAAGLIEGRIADPTNGATHYYTPNLMTVDKEVPRQDKKGGTETTPGVIGPDKKPIENYRPGFADDPLFVPVPVPGIEAKDFRFFRRQEDRHRVR